MPRLSAAPITLTPEEENELQRLARAHKTGQKLVERASMILLAAAGTAVHEIARQLGVWPKTGCATGAAAGCPLLPTHRARRG